MTLRKTARIVGPVAALTLVVLAVAAPKVAASGWLVGFSTVAAVVLGADALLFTHALTGGRWGVEGRPALLGAAGATPFVLAAFVVLLVAAPSIYPWIAQPSRAGAGVAGLYLNLVFFGIRGGLLIAGLALFAVLARRSDLGILAAGLGLVWYAIGTNLAAVDWLQSIEPRYTSSAFGAQIIIAQFAAALAWTILVMQAADDSVWNDLGCLLLATTLGESYLILMTFIVHWYGDLPHQAAWYLMRSTHGWLWLEILALLIGAVGPLVALLFASVRGTPRMLKGVAVASLAGVLLENIWLVAPPTSAWAVLSGPLAFAALAGLLVGFRPAVAHTDAEREVRHGV